MRPTSRFVSIAALVCLSLGLGRVAVAACTVPNQLTNGQMADATQVMANFSALLNCANNAPAGSTNAVQFNAGSGSFGGIGPLSNGQLVVGSTGSAPAAATLTAGPGIAITNGPGSITIGSSAAGGVDWLNYSALVAPVASNFTLRTSTTAPTGAAVGATTRGLLLSSTAAPNGTTMMAEVALPTGHWQATMLWVYSGPLSNYVLPAICVRDSVNAKSVQFGIGGSGGSWRFDYQQFSGGVGLDSYNSDSSLQDAGLPPATEPIWARLAYDGTNLTWSFSRDGEHFVPGFKVSATNWLANLSTIGPSVTFAQPNQSTWPANMHILSWSLVSM